MPLGTSIKRNQRSVWPEGLRQHHVARAATPKHGTRRHLSLRLLQRVDLVRPGLLPDVAVLQEPVAVPMEIGEVLRHIHEVRGRGLVRVLRGLQLRLRLRLRGLRLLLFVC